MKLYKSTIGLGLIALMFSACDKAAEQGYTPAAPVTTPPAYFALDYDGSVIIDENQTSFTVPVYRANTAGEQTVTVNCSVNGDFFSYQLPGEPNPKVVAFQKQGESSTAAIPVTFADGESTSDITIVYEWANMSANAGKEFKFDFKTDGASTEYFTTEALYSALFIPWEPVVGPKGETTGKFVDALVFTGWNVDDPFEYEVEIQSNPLNKGIYRVMTPYANCPTNSPGAQQMQYEGGDIVNIMYINATDPDNVYLCDKLGEALPEYETYYIIDRDYGKVSYFDRAAGEIAGRETKKPNAGYTSATLETQEAGGKVYPNYIVFPEDHFYVLFDSYCENGNELQIIFPGGEGKKEWNDLGDCTYYEGFMTVANGYDPMEYSVPIQQHIENPNIYRLIDPYTNYWPEENPQDDEYPIKIDCSEPEFVTIARQNTGNWIAVGRNDYDVQLTNAAMLYTQYLKEEYLKTEDQIISEGLNDTFSNGVINLANVVGLLFDSEGDIASIVEAKEQGWPGCKVTLPATDAGAKSFAAKASRNNVGIRYARKPLKFGRDVKAVPMFDIDPVRLPLKKTH